MDTGAIKEKIEKGGNGMPGGLVPAEKLDDMAKWVSEIK
ncbi:Cytochrome c-550 [Bacillus licheniformis]|jgi:cytochrome c550|nr:Cytochrome c-550 [Bacillus licheniformis]